MEIKRLMETKTQKVINWKAFTVKRVVLWFIVSLAISFIFFQEFWASLGTMLSLNWIFSQYHAASWGILALCKIWLWFKRKDIWEKMQLRPGLLFIPLGLALVAGAVLMPSSQNYLVFQVLLASLGIFIILFGKAARFPSILLGIYGFAVSLPLIIERFAELPYSMSAIKPVVWILTSLGYPLVNEGQMVHLTTSAGEPISVAITAACAGPATMGVFLAIFALMMLDITLRPRKATWLFVFGVVGTWFQSIIRLIILMLVGHYWGEAAMWTAHAWTIYILFPLWYLLFAYIYFRQAGSLSRIREEARAQLGQAINVWKARAVVKDTMMKKVTRIAPIFIVVALVATAIGTVSLVYAAPDTETLNPDAGGDYTEWDVTGTSNYAATSDGSDGTDIYTGIQGEIDLMGIQNHSAGSGTINSVTIWFRAQVFSGAGSPERATTYIKTNATEHTGGNNTMVSEPAWGQYSEVYNTNPQTVTAWTWAEIDALQAGVVAMSIQAGEIIHVSKVWVVVDYTPDWNSYESDYSTSAETYTGSLNTIYMNGTGFAVGNYIVKYYDAGATQVGTDANIAVGGGGILQSTLACNTNPVAAQGTWSAEVYLDDGSTLIATDTFTVNLDVIPEFSTIMAAIGVAGLCFGIYFWMRKRYQKVRIEARIQ